MAMGRYIHAGLEQAGLTVTSIGPYSRGTIPWGDGQISYRQEYWKPPKIETPDYPEHSIETLFEYFDETRQRFDCIIQAGDTYFLKGQAPIPNIVIGTDPHVIDYTKAKEHADYYFSMQRHYAKDTEGYMPYGYDPDVHQLLDGVDNTFDVVLCGLQYEHRVRVLNRVKDLGYRVFAGIGPIYEEYATLYNSSHIAFNYSSQNDLPARFWEGLAMGRCVVTNRVPDLFEFNFIDGIDYLGFSSEDEAVEKIQWALSNPDKMQEIAMNGYKKVQPHTYKNRVIKMLETTGVFK